jgi:hypothetical protein
MSQQNSPFPVDELLDRQDTALAKRLKAAQLAQASPLIVHENNGEERLYADERCFTNFTKGLPHDTDGFAQSGKIFQAFAATIRDTESTDKVGDLNHQFTIGTGQWLFYGKDQQVYNAPTDDQTKGGITFNLQSVEAGKQYRRWEAPTAGLVFETEGFDPLAVTMPPAPSVVIQGADGQPLANPELVAELAELYWLALLRDVSFRSFDTLTPSADDAKVDACARYLQVLPFYQASKEGQAGPRGRQIGPNGLDRNSVFRGQAPGELKGPYLSQFLLLGTPRRDNKFAADPDDHIRGKITYGSLDIDLRVRQSVKSKDYMTHWNEWLDIQNGADVRDAMQTYVPTDAADSYRFITTPRDLATYVHFDALYEAYLNACLTLLELGAPVDENFKDLNESKTVAGFALFGGPHILTLVTEVATRALKAVRFQKFNVHLRARPEVLAARVAYLLHNRGKGKSFNESASMPLFYEHVGLLTDALAEQRPISDSATINLLEKVAAHNAEQNARHMDYLARQEGLASQHDLVLLPMAFAEGSPMHPAYGAGHATVAGACVTTLKAFFETDSYIVWENATDGQERKIKIVRTDEYRNHPDRYAPVAFVPNEDGMSLEDVGSRLTEPLTVEGELNKLATNISIGRNMAGVHYYSDYIDSLSMGEKLAEGILREQAVMYRNDRFDLSFPRFDSGTIVLIEADASTRPTFQPVEDLTAEVASALVHKYTNGAALAPA